MMSCPHSGWEACHASRLDSIKGVDGVVKRLLVPPDVSRNIGRRGATGGGTSQLAWQQSVSGDA